MIPLQEFIDKYNGKFVEYHSYSPAAKFQCTDLANQYIVEVLNLQAIIGTNAQDFPSKAVGFEVILNTPTGIPSPGDLVIFKSSDGVGHISIFVSGNASLFTSFDQNYPTGSPCKLVNHNYWNVISWLHSKGAIMANELEVCLKDRQKFWDERDTLLRELQADSVEGGLNTIRGLRSRITDLTNQLGTAQAEQKNKEELLSRSQAKVLQLQDDINSLDDKLDISNNTVVQLGKDKGLLAIENEQLKIQVETLKQQAQQGEVSLTIADLFKLIWNQKITIKKG